MVQGGVFECHFVVLRKFAILGAIAGHYCEVSCCNAGPRNAIHPIGIWGINIYLEHPGTCSFMFGILPKSAPDLIFSSHIIVGDLPRYCVFLIAIPCNKSIQPQHSKPL